MEKYEEYKYSFDDEVVGTLRLPQNKYRYIYLGLQLLRDQLESWNTRAIDDGAKFRPYAEEVEDLTRMIEWDEGNINSIRGPEVVVRNISISSLRYAKAGLYLVVQHKRRRRSERSTEGWPKAALRSLDDAIDQIETLAAKIIQEPHDVLWEITPKNQKEKPADQKNTKKQWDVFVSHAHEDKESIARPLSENLKNHGYSVWFDEFTLTIGDSIRKSIDFGLSRSRFGIIILSPYFMEKVWAQKELDAFFSRELDEEKVILPVWHNITAKEIREKSPLLADRLATSSDRGLPQVLKDLIRAIENK